jgi:hypothetical protein
MALLGDAFPAFLAEQTQVSIDLMLFSFTVAI